MPNDKMSGHFAFWCHISTTLTFSSTPPFGVGIFPSRRLGCYELRSEATLLPRRGPWAKPITYTTPEGRSPVTTFSDGCDFYERASDFYERAAVTYNGKQCFYYWGLRASSSRKGAATSLWERCVPSLLREGPVL